MMVNGPRGNAGEGRPHQVGNPLPLHNALQDIGAIIIEIGTRCISLRPIFGRIQPIHQPGNEYFLASFNLS